MKKRNLIRMLSLFLVASLSVMVLAGCSAKTDGQAETGTEPEEQYTLRLYCAGESGATFVSMSGVSTIIQNHKPSIWKSVSVIPSAGPYAGFRAIEAGEGEITYSNVGQMVELWNDKGNLENNPIPKEKKALMGPCLWLHQNILLARADRDDIQSVWDLEGKKVCPTPPGYVTEVVSLMIHDVMDINSEIVYVEMDATCDALKDGILDATWGYVLSGGGVPSWVADLELRMDAKVVPFTKEDTELIASKVEGVTAGPIRLSDFSSRLKGPDDQYSPVLGTYYVFSPDLPEQAVYEIMEALYENKEAVGETHPKHTVWAEDALGLQEQYMDAVAKAGIPLHPGFAKWLKEHNVWHDSWIIGETNK